MYRDERDCVCGCGRYGNCSWAPYWRPETEDQDPHFDFQAMPDITILGLGDAYDDRQIDAVLEELIRLRAELRRTRAAFQTVHEVLNTYMGDS